MPAPILLLLNINCEIWEFSKTLASARIPSGPILLLDKSNEYKINHIPCSMNLAKREISVSPHP